MYTFHLSASDTSNAWAAACLALDTKANKRREGFHTVVRIDDAAADDRGFRAKLDRIRTAHQCKHPIETVANTIFPTYLAATARTPEQLVSRYRQMYATLRRLDSGNRYGTYFGRIVNYPSTDGPIDQLNALIRRLRSQNARTGPLSAAYEMDIAHPADPPHEKTGEQTELTAMAIPIHRAGKDTQVQGFPCLSHCSFQLDRDGVLHMVAHYRNHYMFERAYGNYLGLGRLQVYIAAQAGLRPGALTVVAGHAQIEAGITAIRPLLHGIAPRLSA